MARADERSGAAGPAGPELPAPVARASDDPPPFWGRWGRIYLLVAGLLLVETGVFYWLTRWAP